MKREVVVILHNIRSVYNVGSIFRTADAAGASRVYLCGITPTPIDRFGRKRNDLAKVALGAEESVSWKYFKTTEVAIEDLKRENFHVVSVEQSKKSMDYKKIKQSLKTCFIFGSETEGVPENILSMSDEIAEIPMSGMKESLNVSVTVGIVLFR
jgi:23S rRNA (guanosine2251-2'-O)-methyltransferase